MSSLQSAPSGVGETVFLVIESVHAHARECVLLGRLDHVLSIATKHAGVLQSSQVVEGVTMSQLLGLGSLETAWAPLEMHRCVLL